MQQIKQVSVAKHSKSSWIRYAKYAVEDRAVPDLRDGLIPVRRRILYAMSKIPKLSPTSARIKSAKVVGDTMGTYHPHGDAGIYTALVNMSQVFKNNLMFVSPKGNWGSQEGDPAAAMRYTETKPSKEIEFMMKDINKNVVKFVPTFDGEHYEPEYLPAVVPNLLINGHMGIASGFNSIHLPHNVDEAIDACLLVLDNPGAEIADIMKVLPGPDFPTGGTVINAGDLAKVYQEGKGTVSICGDIEVDYDKKQIFLKSLPFTSTWDRVKEGIIKLDSEGKIPNVLRVINERDHLVVVVNHADNVDETADIIKKRYFSTSFHVYMLVIGEHGLKEANLKSLIEGFLTHRVQVTKKAIQFDIDGLTKQRSKLDANMFLIENREQVLEIIKQSNTKKEAIETIVSIGDLNEDQAKYLIELQIEKIIKEEAEKTIIALKENEIELNEKRSILANEEAIKAIIREELNEAKNGKERLTKLASEITRDKVAIQQAKEEAAKNADLPEVLPIVEEGNTTVETVNGSVGLDNNDVVTVVQNNGIIRNIRAGEWNNDIPGIVLHDTNEDHFVVLKSGAMGKIPINNTAKDVYVSTTLAENDVLGVFPSIDFTHLVVMTNKGRFAAINAQSLNSIISPISLISLNTDEFIESAFRVDNSGQEHCVFAVNEIGEYFKTDLSDTAWMDHGVPMVALPFSKNENIKLVVTKANANIKIDLSDGTHHEVNLSNFIKLNRNSETCKYRVKLRSKTTVVEVTEC